jgi:hypothetical protein
VILKIQSRAHHHYIGASSSAAYTVEYMSTQTVGDVGCGGGGGRGVYVCINISQIFNSEYSTYMKKMWNNGSQRVPVGNERNVIKWEQIRYCPQHRPII